MTNKLRSLTRYCVSTFELESYRGRRVTKSASFDCPASNSVTMYVMVCPFPNSRNFFHPLFYFRMHARKSNYRYRAKIDHERTDRFAEKTKLEKGRGRGRVQIGARTHVNLSAASRCYRGATLMRCILSILLRAPRRCIWPIVHLSICVATIPLLSFHPSSLPPPPAFVPPSTLRLPRLLITSLIDRPITK